MAGPRQPLLHSAESLALAALLLITLVVRTGALWSQWTNLQQDPDAYREIAENLLRHGEFAVGKQQAGGVGPMRPTAYRPPLYPVVLSNLPAADGQQVSLEKVSAVHLLLGVATAWLTWLTAHRLIGSVRATHRQTEEPVRCTHPTIPLLAGLLVACDPILLNQQSLVMTETLAAFLAILSLWCLSRFDANRSWFNAALSGGAIGLAVLCRPTFLPWLGLATLTTLLLRGSNSEFRIQNSEFGKPLWSLRDVIWRLANATAFSLAAAGLLSPWVIRNYRLFHKPIVTTTHGGYTLYLGNNESFYAYLSRGNLELPWDVSSLQPIVFSSDSPLTEAKLKVWQLWQSEAIGFEKERTRSQELLADRVAYVLARTCIREYPREFLVACLFRLRQLWSPLPYKLTPNESTPRRLMRYATAAWYCGVYALAAVGIWRLRWKLLAPPWIWGVLLCLVFTAVHTFYWTNLRMRAPLMPFVAIVAAASCTRRVCAAQRNTPSDAT